MHSAWASSLAFLAMLGTLGSTSCRNSTPTGLGLRGELSNNTLTVPWESGGVDNSLGVGFARRDELEIAPSARTSNELFELGALEAFDEYLMVRSGYADALELAIVALVDYQHVESTLDGQTGRVHFLEVQSQVDTYIPIRLPELSRGWHDVALIAFPRPNEHPRATDLRLPPGLGVAGKRTVLCVEHCEPRSSPSPRSLAYRPAEPGPSAMAFPLTLGEDAPSRRLLLHESIEPDETLPLELWINNKGRKQRDYMIVGFLDFLQFSLEEQLATYLEVPAYSSAVIDFALSDLEPGDHELQFVYFEDPFQPIANLENPFVKSFLRSGIIVE